MSYIFIATSIGSLHFYNHNTKQLMTHHLNPTMVLKKDTPVSTIDFHPFKPHRLLISYKNYGTVIYSPNKHQVIWENNSFMTIGAQFSRTSKQAKILQLLSSGFVEIYLEDEPKTPYKTVKYWSGKVHSADFCGGLNWLINKKHIVGTDGKTVRSLPYESKQCWGYQNSVIVLKP
jgi:hypothetical protein